VLRLVQEGTPLREVLPVQECAQEHLAGGINIPLKKLTRFDHVTAISQAREIGWRPGCHAKVNVRPRAYCRRG
jgi:hypothetical protein